jgi:hypothetical protein
VRIEKASSEPATALATRSKIDASSVKGAIAMGLRLKFDQNAKRQALREA